jgi:hypothetical protein
VSRLGVVVIAAACSLAGCDGLLGINEHVLEEGGVSEDGGARDSESGAPTTGDSSPVAAFDAGSSG